MDNKLTLEDQKEIRYKHEHRMMACSCNWADPCETIKILDALEEAQERIKDVIRS